MSAQIINVRPVEIIAHDMSKPVTATDAKVVVTLHNLLNRTIAGKLTLAPPAGFTLKSNGVAVTLEPGESKDISANIVKAAPAPANAYPFEFTFESDAGEADWERISVNYIRKSAKKIDGNLDDWKDDLGVVEEGRLQKADSVAKAWLPFQEHLDQQPDGSFAEVKLAYDDQYLYVSARVNDPTDSPGHARLAMWDEEQFFHNAGDDVLCESMRPFEQICRTNLQDPKPWRR